MAYKNAKDILPESLLRELQSYAGGELLYIPAPVTAHSGWGDRSGARKLYRERNETIRTMYAQNHSCEELAQYFCLSVDSIRKIVRT